MIETGSGSGSDPEDALDRSRYVRRGLNDHVRKWMSTSSYVAGNRLGKGMVWIFRSERGHHLLVKACQSLDGANLLNHGGEGA